MGLFAFKRAREQVAEIKSATSPVKKTKRKNKKNGNNITHDSRQQHSQQLLDVTGSPRSD
tara:strand:- start:839 stop:1018 length:180 start_codon:yes stop_codon:yes gene_type:complete